MVIILSQKTHYKDRYKLTLHEDSIFHFLLTQFKMKETLLQDNPTDVELITISDMDGIRIVDIIRNSKILLENNHQLKDLN